jgi:cysteine desulfurase
MQNYKNYFDYCATTPIPELVLHKFEENFKNIYGNSSSLHEMGNNAKYELEKAREDIMKFLNIYNNLGKIYFTSCGTESDNIVIRGLKKIEGKNKIMISSIEHDAILESAKHCNYDVIYIPVNEKGLVDLEFIKNNLSDEIALVSVMTVNNETGIIQPIEEIYDMCKEYNNIIFHTDAIQAIGKIKINFNKVDVLSGSAHKFYGPKGIGFLYIKDEYKDYFEPVVYGGGHEYGISSGTVPVPLIMSMADALLYSHNKLNDGVMEKYNLFKELIITKLNSHIKVNGCIRYSLPCVLNVSFNDFEGEEIISYLNMEGFYISATSACTTNHSNEQGKLSHVLKAMGYDDQRIRNSVRISFGTYTTTESINHLIRTIKEYIS